MIGYPVEKHYEVLVVEYIIYNLIGYQGPLNNSSPVLVFVGLYSLFLALWKWPLQLTSVHWLPGLIGETLLHYYILCLLMV